MTCKNNSCRGRCVSPWACGWKDNYTQGATVENGIETPLPITMEEPIRVRRAWLWQVCAVALAVACVAAFVLIKI